MPNIRIHYFQHVPFEGLGYIENWADQNDYPLSYTRFFEPIRFPELHEFDWLIVMGGPMGVYEEDKYTWLSEEKMFIRKAMEAGKTMIGICLGAQLIASASGAKVYPNTKKEIGWFPLRKTSEGKSLALLQGLPEHFTSFHWHGDTFELPAGALHLLESDACTNQAFLYQQKVLGLQFHLETTPQTLQALIDNCRDELVADTFIQSEQEIHQQAGNCAASNEYLLSILRQLAATA